MNSPLVMSPTTTTSLAFGSPSFTKNSALCPWQFPRHIPERPSGQLCLSTPQSQVGILGLAVEKLYIADNKATRQIHENGKAHKEAVEKFLRDVYKRGAADKKEKESVRRELERIEKAAIKQYNVDLGVESKSDGASSSSSSTSKPASSSQTTKKPTPKPAQPLPSPADNRIPEPPREEAMPGEWTLVTPPAPVQKSKEDGEEGAGGNQDDEEEEDPDDLRNFKIVEKTLDVVDLGGEKRGREAGDEAGNEEAAGALFKKRKVVRNIRKKA
ncbi:LOW QUALITY PROTEIN: hypothetical protein BC938DRAFT_472509 [Jimgerdemannia flammicorona]|uniref:U1-type domain-containing protein n=1 Tax=Jimgerdemannia flammicorona TaxID=994334 RepID=A0A433Q5Z5_9FUNG|nr:LOW QUALITY PROTEIN: hypothetical protein BC938DRAFT_472509 [Jimgerdemannia flammicorona]